VKDFLRSPWRAATVLLLAALFLTNIYRAATQSVAHDEGVIYEWLLGGSWSRVLSFEHGNHHVLSDVLCKLFMSIFGTSDFVYRIPALLGGLLYFYSAFSISTLLFGETYLLFVSTAFLSLNPFVLDYLVLARGYGPALGCFFYGLDRLAHYLTRMCDPGAARLLNKAGVGLGLSIGFNIIMIFPGVALAVSLLAIVITNSMLQPAPEPVRVTPASRKERRAGRKRESEPRSGAGFSQALLHFVLPAAAIGGFASMLPNRLIELEVGYLGPASLFAILEGLVRYSLFHSPFGFGGLVAWLPAGTVVKGVTYFVVPLVFLATLVVAARVFAEWKTSRNLTSLAPGGPLLVLLAGLFPVAIVSIVASRYLFDEPYPELRTAMYWIPLLSLAALCILARYAQRGAARPWCLASAALVSLCVIQYATQFNTRYYAEWSYCAAGKDMMRIVRDEHASTPAARVRIGATWPLEPVINFYRVAWGLNWIDPVYRESPNGDYDYYFLAYEDTALVNRLHLKQLLSDPLSKTVLAKRPGR
jgi:hypothetical protein